MNRNYFKISLFALLAGIFVRCGGNDLNKITFLATTQASFTLEATEEVPVEGGNFVWLDNIEVADNTDSLLVDFNLDGGDINTIVPETVDLTMIDEGNNWRLIRTVRLYIYNAEETDSLLMARLDTISTTVNEVITLNANNESLRPYLFSNEFKFKTLLETRAPITTNYNFILTAISRVDGEI